MKKHILDEVHNYTKYKVVELLIKKHQDGITLKNFKEIENLSEDILNILGLVGAQFYAKGKRTQR